jgi:hypothetical protein
LGSPFAPLCESVALEVYEADLAKEAAINEIMHNDAIKNQGSTVN